MMSYIDEAVSGQALVERGTKRFPNCLKTSLDRADGTDRTDMTERTDSRQGRQGRLY